MRVHRLLQFASIVAGTIVGLAVAQAQVGDQPVRIIFPYAAGGSGDGTSRLMAEQLRNGLNRPVIVENRTGAAGRLAVQAVKAAAPDGNTLLLTPIAPMSVFQSVYKNLGYDPIADFKPITQIATFDLAVAVGPGAEVKSLKELVSWLKANPTLANYGMPAAGSLPHFFGVLFGRAAGVDLRAVTYRGSAAALTDLVGGQVPVVFTVTTDLLPMHKAGRIRILATSGAERSPFLADVPTFKESGYDIQGAGWYGMFAPAKTPDDIVERYNKIIVSAIHTPEIKKRLLDFGLEPTGTTSAKFGVIQKSDAALWEPAVKASGFSPQQ
ncbi:MAG: Bug family tripartite tricarboxylate transporter substrate binding protein [Xanthobacteraceae bacterium]